MSKDFKSDQAAKILAKSMIKQVKKAITGKNPVEDVLDPNFKPEADPKQLPTPKESVMNKSKHMKLKAFLEKKKLKKKKY